MKDEFLKAAALAAMQALVALRPHSHPLTVAEAAWEIAEAMVKAMPKQEEPPIVPVWDVPKIN